MGDLFLRRVREELADVVRGRDIRGIGLMRGVEMRQKAGLYLKARMEDHGVLALPAGPNVIRFLPPLVIAEDEIEIGVRALRTVLQQ